MNPTTSGHAPRPARRAARGLVLGTLALAPLLGLTPGAGATPAALGGLGLQGPGSLSLTPSLPSPQPVGTVLTWTASASDTTPLVYRFSTGATATGPFTVVRDYSPRPSFSQAPLGEGVLYVQVTAKEGYTATQTSATTVAYTFSSRVSGGQAVVSATANPLVALYSAPACASGHMLVAFAQAGGTVWQRSNTEQCVAGQSRTFLVAGMLAQTSYQMVNVVSSGGTVVTSTALSFTTGSLPSTVIFPAFSVPQPPAPGSDKALGTLLHLFLPVSSPRVADAVATNLQGQILWYVDETDLMAAWALRLQQIGGNVGGMIYVLGNDGQPPQPSPSHNALRLIDLAGNPLQETNIEALNVQLTARGQRTISGFNHDALRLPNGDTAVIGADGQVISGTLVQGDMLLVLDKNLQVVWTWDAFQHLTPPASGAALASAPPADGSDGSSALPGSTRTIDWTHANAIDYSPADGNLLLSLRNLSWVLKINYSNGAGDGTILWRLGKGGDFTLVPLNPSDPYPWFSYQHDANWLNATTLELFDNGDTRCAVEPAPCDSRGQVYLLNEQTKVVTQTLNIDLGNYSGSLGSAQRLANGNYNFASGNQSVPPPPFAQDIEVLPSGAKVYVQQLSKEEYRAWRLATLYSSITPPCPTC